MTRPGVSLAGCPADHEHLGRLDAFPHHNGHGGPASAWRGPSFLLGEILQAALELSGQVSHLSPADNRCRKANAAYVAQSNCAPKRQRIVYNLDIYRQSGGNG